jgi:hypothetical protein
MNRKVLNGFIIVVLLVGNIIFAQLYFSNNQQSSDTGQSMTGMRQEKKVLTFLKLFVDKVLKAEEEVSFNDRLILENAVRELDDDRIMVKWQAFVDSKDSSQAQDNLRNLLEVLVNSVG